MELTELQLFKGYMRYLVEEHLSTVIFTAKEADPLLTELYMRLLWEKIQPWNHNEKDLWNCFEEFDEWKKEHTGTELEIFKEYIRYFAENYLNEFLKRAREDDFRHSNRDLHYVLQNIEPWEKGEKDLWECFEFDSYEQFVKDYTSYLCEDHFGDCTGIPTTCARCLAEDYFKN